MYHNKNRIIKWLRPPLAQLVEWASHVQKGSSPARTLCCMSPTTPPAVSQPVSCHLSEAVVSLKPKSNLIFPKSTPKNLNRDHFQFQTRLRKSQDIWHWQMAHFCKYLQNLWSKNLTMNLTRIQISTFTPYAPFLKAPTGPSEQSYNGLWIKSPPLKSSNQNPHTWPTYTLSNRGVTRLNFPIHRLQLWWYHLFYCVNPSISTMPFAINAVEIERHGCLQFVHILAIKPWRKKNTASFPDHQWGFVH